MRADIFAYLNRCDADAAATGLDEQPFACLQCAFVEQTKPGGEKYRGHGRGRRCIDALGNRSCLGKFCHGILGVAALADIRDHTLADFKFRNVRADLFGRPGEFEDGASSGGGPSSSAGSDDDDVIDAEVVNG